MTFSEKLTLAVTSILEDDKDLIESISDYTRTKAIAKCKLKSLLGAFDIDDDSVQEIYDAFEETIINLELETNRENYEGMFKFASELGNPKRVEEELTRAKQELRTDMARRMEFVDYMRNTLHLTPEQIAEELRNIDED